MKPFKSYPEVLYLNGIWTTPEKAFVSVFDRAFMFGDGIYEVTPFYQGKAFRLQDHLDRIAYCLKEIYLEFDISVLEPLMLEAICKSNLQDKDAAVYVQISRGKAPRSHFFPEKSEATLLLYAFSVSLENFHTKRWKVLVSDDVRWLRCDIKSTALLANTMANEDAINGGYDENLLVRNGFFTEGSHSTAFFVKQGTIFTHPEGPFILSGITRKIVLEICKDLQIDFLEEAVNVEELSEVDEIFLTGTTTQITSVKSLHFKDGKTKEFFQGEITKLLQQEFLKRTREK